MSLDEYLVLIQKEFKYLFETYKFHFSYTEEYRPGYDWFRVGLESEKCKILFVREQGGGVMFIGPNQASFDDEDSSQWVVLINLLAYILKKKWNWDFLEKLPPSSRPAAMISFEAKELKPVCGHVIEMFSSAEKIKQWLPAYESYLEENFKTSAGKVD